MFIKPGFAEEVNLTAIVRTGSFTQLKVALSNGANPNQTNNDGSTPLMWAAMTNQINKVKYLVKSSAELDAQDNNGRSALMFSAAKSNNAISRYLLSLKANPDLTDFVGQSSLFYAVINGSPSSVEIIAQATNNINQRDTLLGSTALQLALLLNRKNQLKVLLENGADMTALDYKSQTVSDNCNPQVNKEICTILQEFKAKTK